MSAVIFSLDAPHGARLYMYQNDDGTYVIEKQFAGQEEPASIGASAIREHAKTMFRAETVRLLEEWNCELETP